MVRAAGESGFCAAAGTALMPSAQTSTAMPADARREPTMVPPLLLDDRVQVASPEHNIIERRPSDRRAAATAIIHDAALWTLNPRDFADIPRVQPATAPRT